MNVAFAFFVVGYSQNHRTILLGTNNKSVADLLCEQFDKLSDNDDFEVLTADELRFEEIIGEEKKETDEFIETYRIASRGIV